MTAVLEDVILIEIGYKQMRRRGIVQLILNPESCRVMRGSGGRVGTRLGAAARNSGRHRGRVDADGFPAVIREGYKEFIPYPVSDEGITAADFGVRSSSEEFIK